VSSARDESHAGVRAPSGRAVIVLGHGSREKEANDVLRKTAGSLDAMKSFGTVEVAFLEIAEPGFNDVLGGLLERGYRDLRVMPYFLYSGTHVAREIPAVIDSFCAKHPDLKIRLARTLGSHEKMLDIVAERINEALSSHG